MQEIPKTVIAMTPSRMRARSSHGYIVVTLSEGAALFSSDTETARPRPVIVDVILDETETIDLIDRLKHAALDAFAEQDGQHSRRVDDVPLAELLAPPFTEYGYGHGDLNHRPPICGIETFAQARLAAGWFLRGYLSRANDEVTTKTAVIYGLLPGGEWVAVDDLTAKRTPRGVQIDGAA